MTEEGGRELHTVLTTTILVSAITMTFTAKCGVKDYLCSLLSSDRPTVSE